MFRRTSERYVILQDTVPLPEQQAIELAVVDVLPPVRPSQAFVDQLGRDLIAEARQRQSARPEQVERFLQFLGFVSGGIFSLLGGIAIWLLIERNQNQQGRDINFSSPPRPTASASSV